MTERGEGELGCLILFVFVTLALLVLLHWGLVNAVFVHLLKSALAR